MGIEPTNHYLSKANYKANSYSDRKHIIQQASSIHITQYKLRMSRLADLPLSVRVGRRHCGKSDSHAQVNGEVQLNANRRIQKMIMRSENQLKQVYLSSGARVRKSGSWINKQTNLHCILLFSVRKGACSCGTREESRRLTGDSDLPDVLLH